MLYNRLKYVLGEKAYAFPFHYGQEAESYTFYRVPKILFTAEAFDHLSTDAKLLYGILLLMGLPGFFYCKSLDFFEGYGMLLGFVLAVEFEQKYVNFENVRGALRSVLRVVGGVAVFFGLNELTKMPFSADFLNSGAMSALLIRTARYTLVVFVVMGVYPMLFKYTAKWFKKKDQPVSTGNCSSRDIPDRDEK